MAIRGVFEKRLDGFFEVDAALGALEEEGGIIIGQVGEEFSSVGGLSKRGDGAAMLLSNWSEELLGQAADGDNVIKLLWVA